MQVTVYIVRCADGSYYTGLTRESVEARVWEHNNDPTEGTTAPCIRCFEARRSAPRTSA